MFLALIFGLLVGVADARDIAQRDIARGRPSHIYRGSFDSYQLVYGGTIRVGPELRIGRPYRVFAATKRVSEDAAVSTGELFFDTLSDGLTDDNYAPPFFSGARVRVDRLALKGTDREPIVEARFALLSGPEGTVPGGRILCANLDRALAYNELELPNGEQARDEAIATLKEAKELLELGI
jgi:hypothetical protein